MKEITDKMRLDFIEASGAATVTALDKWTIMTVHDAVTIRDKTEFFCSFYKDELKSTLREAIDAAILEDSTYN